MEHGAVMTSSVHPSLPLPWVERFAGLIPRSGEVLDLACGGGRHTRLLARLGYRVEAVDRDPALLAALHDLPGVSPRVADLEGADWPYVGRAFSGVVVTQYLFRPRIADLLALVADPGVLIYETFMVGNENYGRPTNPQFLLRSGELLAWVQARGWRVLAFEEGYVDHPKASVVQRVCAVRGAVGAVL